MTDSRQTRSLFESACYYISSLSSHYFIFFLSTAIGVYIVFVKKRFRNKLLTMNTVEKFFSYRVDIFNPSLGPSAHLKMNKIRDRVPKSFSVQFYKS